ncbi:MAG: hypothetical protein NZ949_07570, partial [Candidatus Kapabacteria bacterium]|nr:hypothetical protein [Candidatus Kapabacteria bacterium]MDW7997592.1 hypothetical protein [Bacteroidota bacterium]
YVLWDPVSRNGHLRAILAGRFLVQVEGGALPPHMVWSRLLEYLPLKNYIGQAQATVPQQPR